MIEENSRSKFNDSGTREARLEKTRAIISCSSLDFIDLLFRRVREREEGEKGERERQAFFHLVLLNELPGARIF